MEASVERAKPRGGGLDQPLEAAVKAGAKVSKMLARMSQLLTWVVMQNGGGKLGDEIQAATQLVHDRGIHALGRVVEALAQAIEQGSYARFGAADGQIASAAGEPAEVESA